MRYFEESPTPALSPWIECLWGLEGSEPSDSPRPRLVVPDGRPELIVHYGQPFRRRQRGETLREGRSLLFGQLLEPIELIKTGTVGVLGARFRPEGAAALRGYSARELLGRAISLADAWKPLQARQLEERIQEARGWRARRAVLEAFLLRQIGQAKSPTPWVAAAVDLIRRHGGALKIESLARQICVSRRELERHFRREVGLTPKQLSRITRFQAVVRRLTRPGPIRWSALATDLGFYDQAHLALDFRTFAGRSPTAYLEANHQLAARFAERR